MPELRKAHGMRERSPGVWEIIVEAGRDPVTGRYRQVSRVFRGSLRDAQKERARLLTEVAGGRHTGTGATLDDLCEAWLVELERKGRSAKTIHGYRQNYRHNVQPTLGRTRVTKLTTKMLTDLYGEHQRRGLSPRSVYQIHATVSSMMTQACRWGWRDNNPAQWADPPTVPNRMPVVPTPAEVIALIEAAERSRRPEYARVFLLAATTGMRRGEICALRVSDIDWDAQAITVARSIVEIERQGIHEAPTKNRRIRQVAIDPSTVEALQAQVDMMRKRAASGGAALATDAHVFSDALDGAAPWRPGAITLYFSRLRTQADLGRLSFHSLRRFMETYGQDLGFSAIQVAMRAGHDPSVAAKHYTGKVQDTDRLLAVAVAKLLRG